MTSRIAFLFLQHADLEYLHFRLKFAEKELACLTFLQLVMGLTACNIKWRNSFLYTLPYKTWIAHSLFAALQNLTSPLFQNPILPESKMMPSFYTVTVLVTQ